MARRWWVRGIVWTGIGFSTLIGVLLFITVWWQVSARHWFKGPIRTVDASDAS